MGAYREYTASIQGYTVGVYRNIQRIIGIYWEYTPGIWEYTGIYKVVYYIL